MGGEVQLENTSSDARTVPMCASDDLVDIARVAAGEDPRDGDPGRARGSKHHAVALGEVLQPDVERRIRILAVRVGAGLVEDDVRPRALDRWTVAARTISTYAGPFVPFGTAMDRPFAVSSARCVSTSLSARFCEYHDP